MTKADIDSTMKDRMTKCFSRSPKFRRGNRPSDASNTGRNNRRGRSSAGRNTGTKRDTGRGSTQGYRQQLPYKRTRRNSSVLELVTGSHFCSMTYVRGYLRCQTPGHIRILFRTYCKARSSEVTDCQDSQAGNRIGHFRPGSAPDDGN